MVDFFGSFPQTTRYHILGEPYSFFSKLFFGHPGSTASATPAFGRVALNSSSDSTDKNVEKEKDKEKETKKGKDTKEKETKKSKKEKKDDGREKKKRKQEEDLADATFNAIEDSDDEADPDPEGEKPSTKPQKKPAAKSTKTTKTTKEVKKDTKKEKKSRGKKKDDHVPGDDEESQPTAFEETVSSLSLREIADMAENRKMKHDQDACSGNDDKS